MKPVEKDFGPYVYSPIDTFRNTVRPPVAPATLLEKAPSLLN